MRSSAWIGSGLVYGVITAILGRDVLSHLGTRIANDPGDPLLTAAILHWTAQHVPWTDAWWQFPIYYPTRDALAFSEHLLGLSVVASPIAWITGNPVATYNLTTLLMFPLCGLAMYALVFHLTRSAAAAFLAGLAYAFAPYRISNLPHIQMLASFWAPLALLGLHGFVQGPAERRRLWWLALYGACWALQAAANWYTLVLFSVLVGLWILWFVVLQRRWRALGMISFATIVAALPLAPLVYTYLGAHARHGFERSIAEVRSFSADVAAVLCAPPNLTFWGWVDVSCRAEGELFPGVALFTLFVVAVVTLLRGRSDADVTSGPEGPPLRNRSGPEGPPLRNLRNPSGFEGPPRRNPQSRSGRLTAIAVWTFVAIAAIYGVIVTLLLVIGPWRVDAGVISVSASDIDKPLLIALAAAVAALLLALVRHAWNRPESVASFYACAALITWLLALGPTVTLMGELSGRPGPFVLVQWLPGVGGLRVPARFWLFTLLCMTTVVGLLLGRLLVRVTGRSRIAVVALAACALLADGWMTGIPAQPLPPAVPDPARLRNQIVLQLPVEPYPDIATTWRAVTGGWTTVNGYSGYAPNYYHALTAASRLADDTMFAPLRRGHDLHVVVADDAADLKASVERQPGVVRTAEARGFTQYRLPRIEPPPIAVTRTIPPAAVRSDCGSATLAAAHDGDERTRWECLEDSGIHGLIVDLGAPAMVSAVVYSVGPDAWTLPTEMLVEASDDGIAWQTLRSGSILGAAIEGGLADPQALRVVLPFPAQTARYVKLRPVNQSDGFGWFVSEVAVRGP